MRNVVVVGVEHCPSATVEVADAHVVLYDSGKSIGDRPGTWNLAHVDCSHAISINLLEGTKVGHLYHLCLLTREGLFECLGNEFRSLPNAHGEERSNG